MDIVHHYITSKYVYMRLRNPHFNHFLYISYSRVTRESTLNLLDVSDCQPSYFQQGIAYRSPTIYNFIPLEIRFVEAYETTFEHKSLEDCKNYYLQLPSVGYKNVYGSVHFYCLVLAQEFYCLFYCPSLLLPSFVKILLYFLSRFIS